MIDLYRKFIKVPEERKLNNEPQDSEAKKLNDKSQKLKVNEVNNKSDCEVRNKETQLKLSIWKFFKEKDPRKCEQTMGKKSKVSKNNYSKPNVNRQWLASGKNSQAYRIS